MIDQLKATTRRLRRLLVVITAGLVVVSLAWGWAVSEERCLRCGITPAPAASSGFTHRIYTCDTGGSPLAGHDPIVFAGSTILLLILASFLVIPMYAATRTLDGLAAVADQGTPMVGQDISNDPPPEQ